MKKSLFIVAVFITNFIPAQNNTIDAYVSNNWNIEHTGSVTSIGIERLDFYKKTDSKIDTSKTTNKVFFDKNDNLVKRYDYWDGIKEPTQIVYYDTLNRILKVKREHDGKITEVIKQYFSNSSKIPDSLIIFQNGTIKREQTINHFSNDLLTKREFFTNDTLRHYNLYTYNSENQLIKKLFVNTPNGFGVTLDKSITGNKSEKYLNPNDSISYQYQEKTDTLIIKEYQHNKLDKIIKKIKNNAIDVVIKEEFWREKLNSRFSEYKWKDSIKTEYLKFNNTSEIDAYQNITTSQNQIIKRWRNSMTNERAENMEIKTIKTRHDDYGNWIKKTYHKDGFIEKEINRTIEYNWD